MVPSVQTETRALLVVLSDRLVSVIGECLGVDSEVDFAQVVRLLLLVHAGLCHLAGTLNKTARAKFANPRFRIGSGGYFDGACCERPQRQCIESQGLLEIERRLAGKGTGRLRRGGERFASLLDGESGKLGPVEPCRFAPSGNNSAGVVASGGSGHLVADTCHQSALADGP